MLYLGRVGRDAHDVRAEFMQEIRQRLIFDIRIVDPHFVSAPFGNRAQVCQAQMWRDAGIDRQMKFRID